MKPARKTSPAPVVSTAWTAKPGERIARSPSSASAPRAERDDQQAVVIAPQRAQRAFGVVDAGQRRRHVLGEHRDGHRRDQLRRQVGEAIDVAGDRNAVGAAAPGGGDGRGLIDVVDVQQTGAVEASSGNLVRLQRQPLVAIPQHDALAGALVDQDDGELIGRALAGEGAAHVDAAILHRGAEDAAAFVVAGGTDVFRAPAEAGARRPGWSSSARRRRRAGGGCAASRSGRSAAARPAAGRRGRRSWRRCRRRPRRERRPALEVESQQRRTDEQAQPARAGCACQVQSDVEATSVSPLGGQPSDRTRSPRDLT